MLQAVGLDRLTEHLFIKKDWAQELSGGEQQRLGFARVLLNRPKLLFLDEATNQLDDASAVLLLRQLRDQMPETVVLLVSHQPAVKDMVDTKVAVQGPNQDDLVPVQC